MAQKDPRKKIDFKHNISIYYSLLKKYLHIFIALLVITLIIELSYTASKFIFKLIIDKGTEFSNQLLSKNQFINIALIIGAVYAAMMVGRALIKWLHIHLIIQLAVKLIFDLKKKFFQHLLYLSHRFHTTHKSGSLISRLTRGGKAVDLMNDVIVFHFTPLLFKIITTGVSLFYFDKLSSLVIIVVAALFIGYSYLIQYLQQSYNLAANEADDMEKGLISDVFTNIESIKYYGKEESIYRKYKLASYKTRFAQVKHWNFFRWWDLGHALILGSGTVFIVLFPLIKFINGDLGIGSLVFIFTSYMDLIGPLFAFVFGMRSFYSAMADFDSLFQYAKIENEVKNFPGAKPVEIKEGNIQFKNITFRYENNPIFENFNLKIRKNENVALVGHSGCGKSTLIKLLYRLYDVHDGEILVDGYNIKDIKQESLREEMAIVPQECILFDDTIYNNISFSCPGAKEKDVQRAIRFSQMDKIIKNFPDKEKTIVGERGVKLSGGEKQRISIARALLARKNIIVLDEATSALDSKTEYEIQRDLEQLLDGKTAIIIAHRLSTIMKADRVIVLKNGRIVQNGPHRELINIPGEYRELWNLQKNGYIE